MVSILGISAFYRDSAAALVVDGQVSAAAQEWRFTRKKYENCFPHLAAEYCLQHAKLDIKELDYVVFYDKPLAKFERLIETYLAFVPNGFPSFRKTIPIWLKRNLNIDRKIRQYFGKSSRTNIVYTSHHESHASSAFFLSPFEEAAIMISDGLGEWATTSIGIGTNNKLEILSSICFPHSLELLYEAFTYYCGFEVNSEEYTLMKLAPYGEPSYVETIYQNLINLKEDGSFWLNMNYFGYCNSLMMTNQRFDDLFGGPPRQVGSQIDARILNIAASIQFVIEEAVLRIGNHVYHETKAQNLTMAGSVALNSLANERLRQEGPFEKIWVQPASGDAGGALGTALFVYYQLLQRNRTIQKEECLPLSLLGPAYNNLDICKVLDKFKATYQFFDRESDLIAQSVDLLSSGKIIGWFQGRMEFGPKALGARSILADPRSSNLQSKINRQIKFRENFQPISASVLREYAQNYGTGIQTIDERHGRFFRLLQAFYEKTACPSLVNTSFNLSGEPFVENPTQAYMTFMQSEMDALIIENYLLLKNDQRLGLSPLNYDMNDSFQESQWIDPCTGETLVASQHQLLNTVTGAQYPIENGIPRLFVPTEEQLSNGFDVTTVVKEFYEKTPFPNYDKIDDLHTLLDKACAGRFARLLNEQIPYDAAVLEIGCGTGQLTNFLSIAHRSVLGTDMCWNSLKIAQAFKERNEIKRATFAQMNLFRPALKESLFDIVICNGVLHHTGNCYAAFLKIAQMVKPGGYVVIGLYNQYSRGLVHYPRAAMVKAMRKVRHLWQSNPQPSLEPNKREAWFRDQYLHPHETYHSISEVVDWFDKSNFEFINSIPKASGKGSLLQAEGLFEPHDPGTHCSRLLAQFADLSSGYREGGFFTVIGRKRVTNIISSSKLI